MASAGELRAQCQHSMLKAGEGYASLDLAREYVANAVEAFYDAAQMAAQTAEQSGADETAAAVRLYMEAESHARVMYASLEEAQSSAMGGNEATEMYAGGL